MRPRSSGVVTLDEVLFVVVLVGCVVAAGVALGYRGRWLELRRQFDALPPLPRILRSARVGDGMEHLLVWLAVTTPGIDLLCVAPDPTACSYLTAQLSRLLPKDMVVSPGSGLGRLGLVNGSRITVRVPRRDGAGTSGLAPDVAAVYGAVDNWVEVEVRGLVRGRPRVAVVQQWQ